MAARPAAKRTRTAAPSAPQNLNLLQPGLHWNGRSRWQVTPYKTATVTKETTTVEAHIGDIVGPLLDWIKSKEAEPLTGCFVGCVAWLTNSRILDALAASKHYTNIVVQKEDFLRRDMGDGIVKGSPSRPWKDELRRRYSQLQSMMIGQLGTAALSDLDVMASLEQSNDPVRCAGYHSARADKHNRPNMHHKFLVFVKRLPRSDADDALERINSEQLGGSFLHSSETKGDYVDWLYPPLYQAQEVWTGSFNMSLNATASRENAVLIRDPKIADLYKEEWGEMVAISEPLDWKAESPDPEYWEGT